MLFFGRPGMRAGLHGPGRGHCHHAHGHGMGAHGEPPEVFSILYQIVILSFMRNRYYYSHLKHDLESSKQLLGMLSILVKLRTTQLPVESRITPLM